AVDVFDIRWRDESWHEVLRLICGMLDERFASHLVDQLLNGSKSDGDVPDFTPANVELAVRCLGELRNLNLVTDTTNLAMRKVIEVFGNLTPEAISNKTSDFLTELTEAIKAIGPGWPNKTVLVRLLNEFDPSDGTWLWRSHFSEFVLALGAGLDDVRDELVGYAGRDYPHFRYLWPLPLAKGWRSDPQTLTLLRQQISNDPYGTCRMVAAEALVLNYESDPETVSLMRDRLEADPSSAVKGRAIAYLARCDDSSSIPLFIKYLSGEVHLRAGSLRALTPHIGDEVVLQAILKQAFIEPVPWLRNSFYDTLSARMNDSRVKEMLVDRAANDEEEEVRAHVRNILSKS
ncbi:MAG TPA: HEAT repeat domain-containing protein, partial [Pyrinomonadaceae bacterium]|nr:HEAT repeat domain-containing protein [Pyrinomonadaceae bacterium]